MSLFNTSNFASLDKISFILLKFLHSVFDFLIFVSIFFYISGRFEGVNEFWITMLAFVSFCVPYVLFASFNGSFIDKYSSVKAFKLSSIISLCVALCVNYFFSLESVSALFILLFILGANRSLYVTSNYVFLCERFKDDERGKAMSINQGLSFLALISVVFIGIKENPSAINVTLTIMAALTVISSFCLKDNKSGELENNNNVKLEYFPLSIFKTFEKMKRHSGINISIYAMSAFWSIISIFCFVMVYRTCMEVINLDALAKFMALLFLGGIVSAIATSFLFKGRVELGAIPLGAVCASISLFCF